MIRMRQEPYRDISGVDPTATTHARAPNISDVGAKLLLALLEIWNRGLTVMNPIIQS